VYSFDMDTSTILIRLSLSALLGGLIGWERERKNKQAGLKTHLLVSLGSTLIMLTSIYGFDSLLLNHPNARFDPARLSAQVVSGIGFLGAGAILRRPDNIISGLTTAATLWIVAAIGLSIGSGFYWPGIITTAMVLLSTLLLHKFESKFLVFRRSGSLKISMIVDERPAGIEHMTSILEKANMKVEQIRATDETVESDKKRISLEFRVYASNGKNINDLFERLWQVKGIKDVRMNWREK
jgi:putative Mg2+ transporter-C (MgtC) family protein